MSDMAPPKVTTETSIDSPNNQGASAKSSGKESQANGKVMQNDAKRSGSVFDFQIELGAAQHKAGTLADTQQGDVDPLPG